MASPFSAHSPLERHGYCPQPPSPQSANMSIEDVTSLVVAGTMSAEDAIGVVMAEARRSHEAQPLKPPLTKPLGTKPITKFAKPIDPQFGSPLLQLPIEVRLIILGFVLEAPSNLYNWLDEKELRASSCAQDRNALLKKGLNVQILTCCQMLLEEGRSALYGTTTMRIQCEWVDGWSRVAIGRGRLIDGPKIVSEQYSAQGVHIKYERDRVEVFSPARDSYDVPCLARDTFSLPSLAAISHFQKVEIALIDNFLDPAFGEICHSLKDIVLGKDVTLAIHRDFPTSQSSCFKEWRCKSVVINNTDMYPGLKDVQDLISNSNCVDAAISEGQ